MLIATRTWIAVLFFVSTIGFGIVAYSQEPSPSEGITGQEQQPHSASPQQPTTNDQQRAAQPPIIVNVSPPIKTETEAAEERHERQEKAALDRRLVDLTGDLARFTAGVFVATIALFLATVGFAAFAFRQSRDMRAAIAVAEEANQLTKESITVEQRAWVAASDLRIENDAVYGEGGIVLDMSVKITNFGKTPAFDVHTDMDMIFSYDEAYSAVNILAKKNKMISTPHTRMALPGDSYRRRWMFIIEPPKYDSVFVYPVVVGCITYKILSDKSIHQTGFVFHLFHCPPGDRNKELGPIRFGPEIASRTEQIGWDGGSGGFAD